MTCSACGADNETAAKFCHACGHAMSAVVRPPSSPNLGTMRIFDPAISAPTGKNPVVAAVLGIAPGVGHFYIGDMKKGAAMFGGAFVFGFVTFGILFVPLAIWSAIDAYRVASGTGKMW
jgi:hypothetical protein